MVAQGPTRTTRISPRLATKLASVCYGVQLSSFHRTMQHSARITPLHFVHPLYTWAPIQLIEDIIDVAIRSGVQRTRKKTRGSTPCRARTHHATRQHNTTNQKRTAPTATSETRTIPDKTGKMETMSRKTRTQGRGCHVRHGSDGEGLKKT